MFERSLYLNELVEKQNNHLIKVITGIRRCGKSYLLNTIFYNHLISKEQISKDHIIKFAFDDAEDILQLDGYCPEEPTIIEKNKEKLVNSKKFILFVKDLITDNNKYYFLLDEIQNLENFVRVLNSFLKHDNFDIYVTGSNSRFLSSEVDTEFGGRGDRIHLLPLTFKEYLTGINLDRANALNQYIRYGGIPLVQLQNKDTEKAKQALSILNETYINDVKDRHQNININNLTETLRVISSMISTPVNPTKIENTFKSVYHIDMGNDNISNYITWFSEAFLLNKTFRYDIKGRKYIGTPYKIYFEDVGIRNAALNFREVDETDIIENVVYNELRYRGFNVDVGVVKIKAKTDRKDKNGNWIYADKDTECDFVARKGDKIFYVQVALEIATKEKKEQEYESIRNIPNSFKKVIIVKNDGLHYRTEEGFLRINLLDFLTNLDSLDW